MSLPGHRRCDQKPPAEVLLGPRFLLLPGLGGGRQPLGGHQGPTAAGHHQETRSAGELNAAQFRGTFGVCFFNAHVCDFEMKFTGLIS